MSNTSILQNSNSGNQGHQISQKEKDELLDGYLKLFHEVYGKLKKSEVLSAKLFDKLVGKFKTAFGIKSLRWMFGEKNPYRDYHVNILFSVPGISEFLARCMEFYMDTSLEHRSCIKFLIEVRSTQACMRYL